MDTVPDEIDWGSSKVARLSVFIFLHDGKPVAETEKVVVDTGFALLVDLQGSLREGSHKQTRRHTESLLRRSHTGVDTPLVEAELLCSKGTDSVHSDEGIGLVLLDESCQLLDIVQDTSRGIDLRQTNQFKFSITLQSLLDFLQVGFRADLVFDIHGLGSVTFEAVVNLVKKNRG